MNRGCIYIFEYGIKRWTTSSLSRKDQKETWVSFERRVPFVPFQGRIKMKPGFPLNDEFPFFPFNNNSSKTYKNKRASLLISNEQG
jgi:hypothetical protein